ncbi:MAG: hypothetical protein GY778_23945 [bacterium]|nr:hypothetical protein [bacterium]
MVLFDRVGSGGEKLTPQDLQRQVERNLAATGWGERAATIVLDPELEVWVWSDSPEVDRCLGWHGRQPALRDWLHEQGMWPPDLTKPPDPKQATEQALRQVRKPRSSAVYERLATKVSLRRCSDPAFLRLRQQLVEWFPFLPAGSSTEQ